MSTHAYLLRLYGTAHAVLACALLAALLAWADEAREVAWGVGLVLCNTLIALYHWRSYKEVAR